MWIEKLTGDLGDKKRYLRYRARMKELPPPHREAGAAIERYLMNVGPSGDSGRLLAMLDDLADLLEQSAADGRPVREVVGEDPVDFVETFMRNYAGSWIDKERRRLAAAIDRAEEEHR